MKRKKCIDEQTLHTLRKYENNGYAISNWLRDAISKKTIKEIEKYYSIYKKQKFVGDFYQTPSGGKCAFYWTYKHKGFNPYIVIAFEI